MVISPTFRFAAFLLAILPAALGCAPAVDESRPPLPGELIDPDSTVTGKLSSGQSKVYQLKIESSRTVAFGLAGASNRVRARLYNSDVNSADWDLKIRDNSNCGTDHSFYGSVLAPGTYLIELDETCGGTTYALGPPETLDPNSTTTGTLTPNGSALYRVDLPSSITLALGFNFTSQNSGGFLRIYDQALSQVQESLMDYYGQAMIAAALSAGIYFVQIRSNYYDSTSFTLAPLLSSIDPNSTTTGALNIYASAWYRVDLSASGTLLCNLATSGYNAYIALYDGNLSAVGGAYAVNWNGSNYTASISGALSPGAYFVKLYANEWYQYYTLVLQFP